MGPKWKPLPRLSHLFIRDGEHLNSNEPFFEGWNQRCGIRIVEYPDTWISRHFWLAKYPDTKKVEYPIIQLSKELRYPSIRILNHLRYPTIHVSIDTWIHGYIQLSIYPCIQVSMDTWILMDKLSFFWLITKNVGTFW